MDKALLLARLLLALVFGFAALSKLFAKASTEEMLRDFQVPQSIRRPVAVALPVIELLAALLLIPTATARTGAILAITLLGVFTTAIMTSLIRGRRPSCQCFGGLSAGPVGTPTLIRNGALLLVAIALALAARSREPMSAVGWFSGLSGPEQVLASITSVSLIVSSATFLVVMQLVAQNGRMLVALDALGRPADRMAAVDASDTRGMPRSGLAPGTRAPEFSLRDITGRTVPLTEFRGLPTLLVFSDPQCGPCTALMPTIGQWQSQLRDRLRVVIVSSGSMEANRAKAEAHGLSHVLLQEQQEVQTLFAAYGTPSAVLIGPDGAIASRVAQGRDDIVGLASSFVQPVRSPVQRQPPPPPVNALPVGTAAPVRPLLDLFGQQADIAYSRTKPTLLLFWNPGCGYCQKMLPDLQAWAMRDSSACDLVVVSSGSPEANLALGLPATILLDHDFALGRDFNVQGTPCAIVVAPDGTVKSALAVGGNAVMALAKASASSAAA